MVMIMRRDARTVPITQRLLAFCLAFVLLLGAIPQGALTAYADTVAGETTTVADPSTLYQDDSVYGSNTHNAGKVTVGKSVSDTAITVDGQSFTPDEDNFLITVSQAAQVLGLATEQKVPVDVVFVLDTSGSMKTQDDTTDSNRPGRPSEPTGDTRAEKMVKAANAAIETLLSLNPNNRVGVVGFSSAEKNKQGNVTRYSASVLSQLYHYTDGRSYGNQNNNAASQHLTWSDSNICGRNTNSTVGTSRNGQNGGTNLHAGIALGASLLMSADTTVNVDGTTVTRMPFLVILSDGQPTYMAGDSTAWYAPSYDSNKGHGNDPYEGTGFIAALTAAYYKGKISEHYYGDNTDESHRCNIYTMAVELDKLSGDEKALAQITMNPKDYTTGTYAQTGNASYWNYGNTWDNWEDNDWVAKSTTNGWKTYWENYTATRPSSFNIRVNDNVTYTIQPTTITATKKYVMGNVGKGYTGGIAYNDGYYVTGGDTTLSDAFSNIVTEIQKKALSAPTKVDATYGEDFSGYVTFTDPVGEYMEVKGIHGILSDGTLYSGAVAAQKLSQWNSLSESDAFKSAMRTTLQKRSQLVGSNVDVDAFLSQAVASTNQAYYNSAADYDNSIVWWGRSDGSVNDDELVSYVGFADDDSVEYIQAQTEAGTIPAGADCVCRSYYFVGTTDGAADYDYMYFVVRVQRSLVAPYQQTVVISIPASLLSVRQVFVTEKTTDGQTVYTAEVQNEDPCRVVYEVGLRSDINAFNVDRIVGADTAYRDEKTTDGTGTNYDAATGTYTFYTNDWNRSEELLSGNRAMAKATFDAAVDNSFYTYQQDTLIYVKQGDQYVPYNGASPVPGDGNAYYYARDVYDWANATLKDGVYENVTKRVAYIPVEAPVNAPVVKHDDGYWYIQKGVYTAYDLASGEGDYEKSENSTGTAGFVAHPKRTNGADDSHYTVMLGNNGKLTLKAQDTKTVTRGDSTVNIDGKNVMVGEILTYHIDVVNPESTKAVAQVTDVIPAGTSYVEGSASHSGTYENGVLTWTDLVVPANGTVTVSFQVEVTEAALAETEINNTADVSYSNGFSYTTNTTKNPPEGKQVTDTNGAPIPETGVAVPDTLVYHIHWSNDSDSTSDITITDIIPEGTSYLEGSATVVGSEDTVTYENGTLTWVLKDRLPGTRGVVSFTVTVNANAKETINNKAIIRIGENDPKTTNVPSVKVKHGDLVLEKKVAGENVPERTFTLTIREDSQAHPLNGTFETETNDGTTGSVTFVDGVATITIRADQTVTIKGLVTGTGLTVSETVSGFTPSYSVAGGHVIIGEGENSASVVVTNTYSPVPAKLTLGIKKVLTSTVDLDATSFGFVAYPCDANGENLNLNAAVTGNVSMNAITAGGTAEKSFTLPEMTFTTPGTYYYRVEETAGNRVGMTYDATAYLVKVVVTDDGTGTLSAATTITVLGGEAAETIVFRNSYAPAETQVTLEGTKTLTGRKLTENMFAFLVTETVDGSEVTVATGTNDATGKIVFTPITYTTEGTHTYTVREVSGNLAGMTYSEAVFTVTVTVEDVDGELKASVTYPEGGVAFANSYAPNDKFVNLTANKVLVNQSGESRTLQNGEFSFVVKNGNTVVATGTNDANGNIAFTAIGYRLADFSDVAADDNNIRTKTYTYTISEVIPDLSADPFMVYDSSSFTVTVTVHYNELTGEITVDAPQYPDSGVTFTNTVYPSQITYTPVANKTTTGSDSTTFSFRVVDVNSQTGEPSAVGVAPANGAVNFSKLTFTQAGEYAYWIMENGSGMVNGITYDGTRYLLKVTVTLENSQFALTASYWKLAEGGDATNPADYTVAMTEAPAFHNTYNASGSIAVTANKVLTGRTLKAGEFDFRLTREGGNQTVNGTVAADGTITFANLHFSLDEEFTVDGNQYKTIAYQMSEIVPENKLPGVTYDTSAHTIYITIYNDGLGNIHASVTDADGKIGDSYFVPDAIRDPDAEQDPDAVAVEAATASGVTFQNSYAPTSATANIQATKELTGRDLRDNEFSFELFRIAEDGTEVLINTAGNNGGQITFQQTYDPSVLGGESSITIKYVIREVAGSLGGVTYDSTPYYVLVTITHNESTAKLETAVEYFSDADCTQKVDSVAFHNEYKTQDASVTPEATKKLLNRKMTEGEFLFQVYETFGVDDETQWKLVSVGSNRAPATGSNQAQIQFTPITYSTTGEHTYLVREVAGTDSSITYDESEYVFHVTVKDNGEGQLVTEVNYYNKAVNFVNVYNPSSISVDLSATKTLTGRDMTAGEFSFVVVDKEGTVVATGDHAAAKDGKATAVTFAPSLMFSLSDLDGEEANGNGVMSKTFTYTVSESAGSLGGVTYDNTVYTATVTISYDTVTGALSSQVAYTSGDGAAETMSFRNSYAPKDVSVDLPVQKYLLNKQLVAGEFTFALTNSDGTTLEEVTNDASGKAAFGTLKFTAPGEYHYTVAESVTDTANKDRYTIQPPVNVTITVTDNLKGELVADVKYTTSGTTEQELSGVAFINEYTVPPIEVDLSLAIDATKQLNGRDLTDADVFEFEVYNSSNELVATGKNDATGKITFPAFTFDKVGEYHYWILEKDTSVPGVTKDSRIWEVIVHVHYNDGTAEVEIEDVQGNKQIVPAGQLYVAKEDVTTFLVNATGEGTASVQMAPTFVNTYIPDSTELTIQASKTLEGRPLANREFLFELLHNNVQVGTARNDETGKVTFHLTFDKAGTYVYEIAEVNENASGVTYDDKKVTVVVTVTDDTSSGKLVVSGVEYSGDTKFVNTYEAAPVQVTIPARKVIVGDTTLVKDAFAFRLANTEDEQDVYTAKNDADGKILFELKAFTEPGTYTYELKEMAGTDSRFTYDETVYGVTITVTDDLKGQLQAEVTYTKAEEPVAEAVFTNTFTVPEVDVTIEASKTITGDKTFAGEQFDFRLIQNGDGTVVATAKNDAEGKIAFDLTFNQAGEYTYILEEIPGDDTHYEYDATKHTVLVKVTENADRSLKAQVIYGTEDEKAPVFVNKYTAEQVVLEATKKLEGRALTDGEFTFQVHDSHGTLVATATNTADGKIVFPAIKLLKTGQYRFTVSEISGQIPNVTYDTHTFEVLVLVEEIEGKLVTTVTYPDDGVVFHNVYTAPAVDVTIEASKTITGDKTFAGEQFDFRLIRSDDGAVVATAKNDAEGKIRFDLTFDQAGKYTFVMEEIPGTDSHYDYDTTKYQVQVKVTQDENDQLQAQVVYKTKGKQAPMFVNKYNAEEVVLEATKKLTGRPLKKGEFTFQVHDSHGTLVATATNTADGKIVFPGIKLMQKGTYVFTVSEVTGKTRNVTYDKSTFEVRVTVVETEEGLKVDKVETKKDIVFTNIYKLPAGESPKTGDTSHVVLFAVVGVVSLIALVVLLWLGFRKNRRK